MNNSLFDHEVLSVLREIWENISKPLFELSGTKISMMSLLMSILILIMAIFLSRLGERYMGKYLARRNVERGVKGSIERITRYMIILVGVFVSLDSLGVSMSSLAALGAVLMVGIGFGLQNVTQNFISGIIILLERPIKVGDLVEVGGTTGRVSEIGIRYTLIRTREEVAILVPNSQFISEQVINESFSSETIRRRLNVGVAYGSDVEKVRDLLLQAAREHEKVLKDPQPSVLFKDFGESSLDFALQIWVNDLWRYEAILSDLRFRIDALFREHEVEIPFPQRDLHIKSAPGLKQKGPQVAGPIDEVL